ncbi:MAG: SIR2 family protein [Myxococcota bacterium]
MKRLPLKTAAARIRETRRAGGKRSPSPFFFVCGAGISVPSVPLAWSIERECCSRAEDLGLSSGLPPDDDAGAYSFWLEQAYPDPDQRRAYFRSKIERQPLTDANLRLAHLLADGALSRLLVTPNFDDFVSRALHLFGDAHVVCDHPATTARIDLDADDVQIVHVHGTYWFYDLVNTDLEIHERAQGMRAGPGMGELLADLLRARSPLVLGYSGWEGDVIMTALKRRLRKPLKHTLYWFCYREGAVESLPSWLCKHPNVCFVMPPEGEALPADRVFDELLRVFKVDAPPLTRDPLGTFAARLRHAIPPRPPKAPPDLYFFDDVLRRVERAIKLAGEDAQRIDRRVDTVRDAVRAGRYDLAARRANGISLRALKKEQLAGLLDALWAAVARGGRAASEDLRLYDAFLRVVDERPSAPVKMGRLASVWIGRAAATFRLGHHRKTQRIVAEAIEAFGPDLSRMPRAHHRLLAIRARALAAEGRGGAALEAYEELLTRFGKASETRLRAAVVGSGRERAALLMKLEHYDEAKEHLDALVRRSLRVRSLEHELATLYALRSELHEALGNKDEAAEDAERATEVLASLAQAPRPSGYPPPASDPLRKSSDEF